MLILSPWKPLALVFGLGLLSASLVVSFSDQRFPAEKPPSQSAPPIGSASPQTIPNKIPQPQSSIAGVKRIDSHSTGGSVLANTRD